MKTTPAFFWAAGWRRATPRRQSLADVLLLQKRRRRLAHALRRARQFEFTPAGPLIIADLLPPKA